MKREKNISAQQIIESEDDRQFTRNKLNAKLGF